MIYAGVQFGQHSSNLLSSGSYLFFSILSLPKMLSSLHGVN